MIVDTSALLAIVFGEQDSARHARALSDATTVRVSTATLLEAGIVADRNRNPITSRLLDDLLAIHGVIVEPLTHEQSIIARDAYRDFGRGSGHPANLNFGDCFAYALARDFGEPLLFKGDDFTHTDIKPALKPSG